MNDEIKEILAYFEEYVKITDMHDSEPMLNWKDLKIVLDYIANLQQENERLKMHWNELEEWVKDNLGNCRTNIKYEKGNEYIIKEDVYYKVLDKMKKIKEGKK